MFRIRLKKLRENKNLSQYDLAHDLSISQSAIGNWESGKREPNFSMMQKIANYFNVSVDYLLGREDSPTFTIPDTLKDTQIAFTDGLQDLDEEELKQVADFVDYLKSRKK